MGANNAFGKAFKVFDFVSPLKMAKNALTPKSVSAPDVPDPAAMPDPLEQQQARRRSLVEQLSRGGRASTIMTDRGKLGG